MYDVGWSTKTPQTNPIKKLLLNFAFIMELSDENNSA